MEKFHFRIGSLRNKTTVPFYLSANSKIQLDEISVQTNNQFDIVALN